MRININHVVYTIQIRINFLTFLVHSLANAQLTLLYLMVPVSSIFRDFIYHLTDFYFYRSLRTCVTTYPRRIHIGSLAIHFINIQLQSNFIDIVGNIQPRRLLD